MATKNTTKAAVLENEETTEAVEVTTKQVINEGIDRVIAATGVDSQKARYKAMRAIAFEAFAQAIESGEFDALVDAAIANVDELPAGWEVERAEKAAPAPKAKAAPKAAATKAPAKKAAPAAKSGTAAPRKRPTR